MKTTESKPGRMRTVRHKGYTASQSPSSLYVMIGYGGKVVHSSKQDKFLTEAELRGMIERYMAGSFAKG